MTEKEKIKGTISDLFFFDSKVSQLKKEEVVKWFLSLTPREMNNVKILIQEAKDEENFFAEQREI